MAENAGARFRRRVLQLQLRVWLIAFAALVVGVALSLVPWIVSGRLKLG
jgi:hypothetical protein